jgi:CheY-like chemotaxis protein
VPATLLLADDSVTIQRVIELTFADEDVNVVAVSDGDAAIARLETSPPDIVLADVGMPGKSGYDVAQYVKARPRLAHIPVVLLTGAFEPVDQGRASAAGCDGVLAKPFEPQLVISRVKELLARRQPQAVPPAAPAAPRRTDLDEYFDQLDAAFANLASTSAARKPAPQRPRFAEYEPAAPVPDVSRDAAGSDAASGEPAQKHSENQPALPSLADAFSALLTAERNGVPPPGTTRWPAAAGPVPLEIDDQVIAEIARRVAAQLSGDHVRAAVNELVAATAERLVREEIERIKASIK